MRKLPGNFPHVDQFVWLQSNFGAPTPTGRIDTVYVSETITERVFTSDTVYINETITLSGDVDTLVVERRLVTRDTVYNFTENTNIDVVFIGADFGQDNQLVLATNEEVKQEVLAYPNPASGSVTIRVEVPTNAELKVYDRQGRVRQNLNLAAGSSENTVNLSSLEPGIYLYMIVGQDYRSKAQHLIVE